MMAAVCEALVEAAGRASRLCEFRRGLCRRSAAAYGKLAGRADEPARRHASGARADAARRPRARHRSPYCGRRWSMAPAIRTTAMGRTNSAARPIAAKPSSCSARARNAAIMSMSTTLPRSSASCSITARRACLISRPARSRVSARSPTRRSRCRRARSRSKPRRATGRCRITAIARSIRRRRCEAFPGFHYTADRRRSGAGAAAGIRLMPHLDLLRALPKTKRNIQKRAEAKDPAVIAIAKQYGEMYWDGPREYGYGGYRDDGRWHPVARDIIAQYGLKPGMRVLDVGCGKGFLVKALLAECPGPRSLRPRHLALCADALFARSRRPHCISAPRRNCRFPTARSIASCRSTPSIIFRGRARITAMREIQRLSGGPRLRSG